MTDDKVKQQRLLEKFVLSEELEELNLSTNQFNIFTALKLHNNEIRHSNFLGWLMAPYESHGLGDYFLKEFLKVALKEHSTNDDVEASISDVVFQSFENAEIRREWKNIDILVINPSNKFLCVVENKVWSGEHSEQLERYAKISKGEFRDYKKIFVFLTPTPDINEQLKERGEGVHYIQMDYGQVNEMLEKTLKFKAKSMTDDVRIFVEHYKTMIERNIMGTTDATIVELCRKIYREHKEAIKLINENSNTDAEIIEVVREIASEWKAVDIIQEGLHTFFLPKDIEGLDKLRDIAEVYLEKSIIMLHIRKGKNYWYAEIVGRAPVTIEAKDFRNKILTCLSEKRGISFNNLNSKWCYSVGDKGHILLVSEDEYDNFISDREKLKKHIMSRLEGLFNAVYNGLNECLKENK